MAERTGYRRRDKPPRIDLEQSTIDGLVDDAVRLHAQRLEVLAQIAALQRTEDELRLEVGNAYQCLWRADISRRAIGEAVGRTANEVQADQAFYIRRI